MNTANKTFKTELLRDTLMQFYCFQVGQHWTTATLYPFVLHSIAMSLFASVIGPFGGFFASGFKRAFKIKVLALSQHVYVLKLILTLHLEMPLPDQYLIYKHVLYIQDFGDTIPGHGGFMDRFDCQLIMATFVHVYHSSFIK